MIGPGMERRVIEWRRRRARGPQQPDPASHAAVSVQPIARQVSHTTPSGVSQPGQPLSARSRWRSTICEAPNPLRSPSSSRPQTAAPGSAQPGTGTRFQTMLVAPQPWLSLAPTTKRLVRRASATTESRRARESSLALGDAFTISNPSSSRGHERVQPAPVVPLVLRERQHAQRAVGRVALAQQREERVERAVVAALVHRQRVAQQDDVGLPRAHLDAGAERRRAGVRHGAR